MNEPLPTYIPSCCGTPSELALKNTRSPEEPWLVDLLIHLDVYEGNPQKALDRLSLKSEDLDDMESFIPSAMRYADT